MLALEILSDKPFGLETPSYEKAGNELWDTEQGRTAGKFPQSHQRNQPREAEYFTI